MAVKIVKYYCKNCDKILVHDRKIELSIVHSTKRCHDCFCATSESKEEMRFCSYKCLLDWTESHPVLPCPEKLLDSRYLNHEECSMCDATREINWPKTDMNSDARQLFINMA